MHRTPAQIREHYDIEKGLADRLRAATRAERPDLYGVVYGELYRRVTHLEYHARKASREDTYVSVLHRLKILGPFLKSGATFVEFGAGDCSLSLEVALRVKQATAVEVSDTIAEWAVPPANFRLVRADALQVEIPPGSVDVIYSNDFIEHLHPEDAPEHLRQACAMLKPGGVCICITPNRASGPWDISRVFDKTATCLHLKEYTVRELDALFRAAGFSKTALLAEVEGRVLTLPFWPAVLCERILALMPTWFAQRFGMKFPFRNLLGVNLIGVK